MKFTRRDIWLKIEPLSDYSPLAPIICSRHYGRDCMFNPGHESGRVAPQEIFSAALDALVYREYLDPHYSIPNTAKIIEADVNEPPWNRRVPGAVLYAKPGERLYIHVWNGDKDCHSFHLHGLKYGIDSDGAWPFGVMSPSGRRSDEILPGQSWTYVFDATPETIGAWAFHDHVRNVQANVNRGLFGGLIVRHPQAPCADHEIPLFVHQLEGASSICQFQSPTVGPGQTFSFKFNNAGVCNYHCLIHGIAMSGQVQVVAGGSAAQSVSMLHNSFNPPVVSVAPGGTVTWTNNEPEANHNHIVFASGGGAASFCLNGRSYVGNTPTIVTDSGERLRWYVFNLDFGGVWHNFHPHSTRWQLPAPPGGAADVHSLSPAETFVADTEAPPALRLPCALEELQCDPPPDACRVRLRGDFLFHCHIEEHMMQGLAGLLRARQWVWVTKDIARKLPVELPYDDGSNDCPHVDVFRCAPKGSAMPGMAGGSPDLSEAATMGFWELLPCDSQVLAVHAVLLHTGKVLFFAGSGNDPAKLAKHDFRSVVWDYENGSFFRPPTPIDFFCAGQATLSNGRVLVAGGTKQYQDPGPQFEGLKDAYLFEPTLEAWIRVADMADGRWYPTLVSLGDGRVFAISGLREAGGDNRVSEIFSELNNWTALPASNADWPLYPHFYLLRNGHLFYAGGSMGGRAGREPLILNPLNGAVLANVPGLPDLDRRNQSASVLLPPVQKQQVMIMGGGDPAVASTAITDLSAGAPSYAPGPSLNFARMHLNAVLLPDRTVFVSGGGMHSEGGAVLDSEIYDPVTNTWRVAAKATVPRFYHSVALLLPDGRVITAGSNPNRTDDELRLELYHPPYLFKGPRPFIDGAPADLTYGETFEIHTPQAENIQWVQLMRPMATTHSCDTQQRLVDIHFECAGLCTLRAFVPREANIAPPGWYMLSITDRQGVPSAARWVHLEMDAGLKSIQTVKIHSSIGIARVGNSPSEFFVGPELPGDRTPPEGGYKDSEGRMKRQAARFRIFGYDVAGRVVQEITAADAIVVWTAHLANGKAAWNQFDGLNPITPPRNADVADRSSLIIDPGPRSLDGPNQKALFDTGKFMGQPVPLGEMRTDEQGRLLVLGGFGHSSSPTNAPIVTFADNDGWHDDVSDGPVNARVVLNGSTQTLEAAGAWVIVSPPDFAPPVESITSLYDTLLQVAVDKLGYAPPSQPSFTNDVYPILRRAMEMRWVSAKSGSAHKTLPGAIPPPAPDALRAAIFARLRSPFDGSGGDMPMLWSDTEEMNETVTKTQYTVMEKWKNGDFIDDWSGPPAPATEITPDGLDRAALEACVGGAFFPGIDGSWFLRDVYSYSEPFRLDGAKLAAGDVTKQMAVPWQADFFDCQIDGDTSWWPAQRPDDVFPEDGSPQVPWTRDLVNSSEDMIAYWYQLGVVAPRDGGYLETERKT